MEAVLDSPWARGQWKRRITILVAIVVLAVLCVWPRHYVARAELLPDEAGKSLASVVGSGAGALLSFGSLLGNQSSIESDLTIARSQVVVADVAQRLRREGRLSGDFDRDLARLRHKIDMEAMRGSILRITFKDRDPRFALAVVSDFVAAIRARVAAITLEQSAQKRAVAINRLNASAVDLARAQQALDRFRAANRLAAPEVQLGAAVSLMTQLQAKLDADQAQLQALQRFATDNNFQVQALQAEVASLRGQIAQAQANANNSQGPSVGAMSPVLTEYANLFRNERFAEAEYDIYERYLGTVTVEALAAGINMDMVEPPYVDPDRQYNMPAVGALILVLLLSALAEFYISQTPVHRRPIEAGA